MWPTIRDGFMNFFTDKTYFVGLWDRWVAKVRGMIMAAGAAVVVYGDQIAAQVPPTLQNKVKLAGIALMAFSLMLRAGDKNPVEPK
jgi:hypothetical protein